MPPRTDKYKYTKGNMDIMIKGTNVAAFPAAIPVLLKMATYHFTLHS